MSTALLDASPRSSPPCRPPRDSSPGWRQPNRARGSRQAAGAAWPRLATELRLQRASPLPPEAWGAGGRRTGLSASRTRPPVPPGAPCPRPTLPISGRRPRCRQCAGAVPAQAQRTPARRGGTGVVPSVGWQRRGVGGWAGGSTDRPIDRSVAGVFAVRPAKPGLAWLAAGNSRPGRRGEPGAQVGPGGGGIGGFSPGNGAGGRHAALRGVLRGPPGHPWSRRSARCLPVLLGRRRIAGGWRPVCRYFGELLLQRGARFSARCKFVSTST